MAKKEQINKPVLSIIPQKNVSLLMIIDVIRFYIFINSYQETNLPFSYMSN